MSGVLRRRSSSAGGMEGRSEARGREQGAQDKSSREGQVRKGRKKERPVASRCPAPPKRPSAPTSFRSNLLPLLTL